MPRKKIIAVIEAHASKIFNIPTGLALSVFMAYAFLLYAILPQGVNRIFVNSLGNLTLGLLSVWFFMYVVLFVYQKQGAWDLRNHIDRLSRVVPQLWNAVRSVPKQDEFAKPDLLLLLFPLTPIVQYIALNQDMLSWTDSLLFFSIFSLGTFCLAILVPFLAGAVVSRQTLMLLAISLGFCLFSMPSWALEFSWHERGDFLIQATLFTLVFAVLSLLYVKNIKLLYVFVIIYFISNTAMHAYGVAIAAKNNESMSEGGKAESKLYAVVEGKTIKRQPNIYLLTYDGYVGNATMLQYGIDNGLHEADLRQLGFKIYDSLYSIGGESLLSMSKVLDVSLTSTPRVATSGNGAVQNILKSRGYQTYGIFSSSYLLLQKTLKRASYEDYFPKSFIKGYQLLSKAVGEGEFRFDIIFEKVDHSQYVAEKRRVFEKTSAHPLFLYTHSSLPGHSQNSGRCHDNEIEEFEEKLAFANREMREDIDAIMRADRDAIIIVNGDHGPYLTGDCLWLDDYAPDQINRLMLQDRHGTFLAIKWPDDQYTEYDQITILQDIFPAVLAYLFEDPTILGSKLAPPIR